MAFYAPGPSVIPEPLNSTLPLPPVSPGRALTVPDVGDEHREPPHPIALGDGRHDGGGVGSRPGRAGHSAAGAGKRGPGGKDPKRRRGGEPAGGRAGWRAGGRQATSPPPAPPLPSAILSYQPPIGSDYCRSDSGSSSASSLIGPWTKARCYDWPSGPLFPFAGRWGEGALPEGREEFGYVRWDRPLREAGSDADWIPRRAGLV